MSLSTEQRRRTSVELRANLQLSGLTVHDLATQLDLEAAEVERTLNVAPGARPELVWLLRDHLETAARAHGVQPHPYTHLPEHMRAAASTWFPMRDTR